MRMKTDRESSPLFLLKMGKPSKLGEENPRNQSYKSALLLIWIHRRIFEKSSLIFRHCLWVLPWFLLEIGYHNHAFGLAGLSCEVKSCSPLFFLCRHSWLTSRRFEFWRRPLFYDFLSLVLFHDHRWPWSMSPPWWSAGTTMDLWTQGPMLESSGGIEGRRGDSPLFEKKKTKEKKEGSVLASLSSFFPLHCLFSLLS